MCFSNILHAKLLTHFEFEDSLEDSVGDNNGTFNGSESYLTGKNGKALNFNGKSNYLEFGKADFNPRKDTGRYSISMWVYSTSAASSSNNNAYIGKHTDSGDALILFGYLNNQLYFKVNSKEKYISAAGNEPAKAWVHYVVSAREKVNEGKTSVVIYKNGSQIWSGTLNDVAGTFEEDDKPWVLGMNWDSATSKKDFFQGKMDSVRIYNWNITADEVREIYLKESAKLHLKLDDTFNDSIGTVTGSKSGDVTFKQGMENRSAYFDGSNDYVSFGTGTTKPGVNGYSISLWVKSNAKATASNNNAYIVKQTDTNGDIFRFGYWNNKLILKIKNSSANISTATEPTTLEILYTSLTSTAPMSSSIRSGLIMPSIAALMSSITS